MEISANPRTSSAIVCKAFRGKDFYDEESACKPEWHSKIMPRSDAINTVEL